MAWPRVREDGAGVKAASFGPVRACLDRSMRLPRLRFPL